MSQRLDGMGVAEPVIRARGDNAIEIQLAGLSTKDNPEVIDSVKKPARLEFRSVHPDLLPDSNAANRSPVGYEASMRRSKTANLAKLMSAVNS